MSLPVHSAEIIVPSRITVISPRKASEMIIPIHTKIQSEHIFTLEKGNLNLSQIDNYKPSGAFGTTSIAM